MNYHFSIDVIIYTCYQCYFFKILEKNKDPRKVFNLTLEKKAELIAAVDQGNRTKWVLAEEYGIAPSTLCGIMVNRVRIMEAFHNQAYKPERKKFRKSSFQDLEEELLKIVIQWQSMKVPFNGPKLMEKAKEIAKKLEISDFVGSNGWIDRFKNRNNIKYTPGCEVVGTCKEYSENFLWFWLIKLNRKSLNFSPMHVLRTIKDIFSAYLIDRRG